MIYPLILCGGVGKRLWPLSTDDFPKQFLSLDGKQTLLEKTVARVSDRKRFKNPLFVSNVRFKSLLKAQAKAGDFIFEPCLRNTGPALIVSILKIYAQNPKACVLVLPSDHTIGKESIFQDLIQEAKQIALQEEKMVLFGIVPNRPEAGYGYIEPIPLANHLSVKNFKEKPDEEIAKSYIKKGYLWNSGMFLFTAETFLKEIKIHAPDLFQMCFSSFKEGKQKEDGFYIESDSFSKCPSVPIDIALMEKTKEAIVLPADIEWSDVGNWQSVWKSLAKNDAGVFKTKKAQVVDSKDCYINTESVSVSVLGLENIAVLEKNGKLLVINMDKSSEIKKLFD